MQQEFAPNNQRLFCEFAMWNKPTGEKCSICEGLMSFGKGNVGVCGNKECGKG